MCSEWGLRKPTGRALFARPVPLPMRARILRCRRGATDALRSAGRPAAPHQLGQALAPIWPTAADLRSAIGGAASARTHERDGEGRGPRWFCVGLPPDRTARRLGGRRGRLPDAGARTAAPTWPRSSPGRWRGDRLPRRPAAAPGPRASASAERGWPITPANAATSLVFAALHALATRSAGRLGVFPRLADLRCRARAQRPGRAGGRAARLVQRAALRRVVAPRRRARVDLASRHGPNGDGCPGGAGRVSAVGCQ